jgi:uncharacterized protein YutE (UPF0331/DUF86 family)
MADASPRKADSARWQREIVEHLADFPRQYAALESAMAAFGEDFELGELKQAYETETDMEAYNRAQAVERALARVQNYVADLSITGVKLAQLAPAKAGSEGPAQRAFSTLAGAGVIDGALCRRLNRAQRARTMIERSYIQVPAGNVHGGAELVREAARDFIGPYRTWIEQHL